MMIKTSSDIFYYAIRDISDEPPFVTDVLCAPVSCIAHSPHGYQSRWVHRRLERLAKHISYIEQWEYDMLDAFGVPKVEIHAVLEWESFA